MSEPDHRYDTPLPGQPLADQPTEDMDVVEYLPRHETAAVTTPISHPPTRAADRVPAAWEPQEQPPLPLGEWDDGPRTQPDYRDAPVVVRRADTVAGLLLLLAGIAAGVSLLVVWRNGDVPGLDLVRAGLDDLRAPQRLADQDTWEPLAVLGGGIVLFVLGLLAFVPAKSHRFLGAVAVVVSLVVAAGVLVPLADAGWDLVPWAVGAWFTVAVAGLGFLGGLKALATSARTR